MRGEAHEPDMKLSIESFRRFRTMQVLTPFVADPAITLMGSEHEGGDRGIHERDVQLLRQSNVVVAEVGRELLIIDL